MKTSVTSESECNRRWKQEPSPLIQFLIILNQSLLLDRQNNTLPNRLNEFIRRLKLLLQHASLYVNLLYFIFLPPKFNIRDNSDFRAYFIKNTHASYFINNFYLKKNSRVGNPGNITLSDRQPFFEKSFVNFYSDKI